MQLIFTAFLMLLHTKPVISVLASIFLLQLPLSIRDKELMSCQKLSSYDFQEAQSAQIMTTDQFSKIWETQDPQFYTAPMFHFFLVRLHSADSNLQSNFTGSLVIKWIRIFKSLNLDLKLISPRTEEKLPGAIKPVDPKVLKS